MNIAIHRASTAPAGYRGQDLQDQLLGCLPVRAIAALAAPGGVRCRGPFWASAIGRWLQQALGVPVTGRIGPETVAAAAGRTDHQEVIDALLNLRLAFLQRRKNWNTFKKGWVVRIEKIRKISNNHLDFNY